MASYNELIALIDAFIKRNGVQAITGQILNGVLKAMVDQVGRGYAIMGVATPSTNPGTPDAPESWFASTPGTYTNFGGLEVADAEFALLSYTPSGEVWTKTTLTEGIQEVSASIDGKVGTPEVTAEYINGGLIFTFSNMKGQTGDAAGFGTVNATVDGNIGTPGVSVNTSGPDTAKNITFAFRNLKGETGVTSVVATVDNTSGTPSCAVSLVGQELHLDFHGLKGAQGNTGSSVDYPFTIVNNLTTDDPTQALSAAQGVVLAGELSQLEAEVNDIYGMKAVADKYTFGGVSNVITFNSLTLSGDGDAIEFKAKTGLSTSATAGFAFLRNGESKIAVSLTNSVLGIKSSSNAWISDFDASNGKYNFGSGAGNILTTPKTFKLVFDSTTLKFYIDGTLYKEVENAPTIAFDRIGGAHSGNYWSGEIEFFRYSHNGVTTELQDFTGYSATGDVTVTTHDVESGMLTGKVDKVPGKGLSTNDFTNEDKAELDELGKADALQMTDDFIKLLEDKALNDSGEQLTLPIIKQTGFARFSGVSGKIFTNAANLVKLLLKPGTVTYNDVTLTIDENFWVTITGTANGTGYICYNNLKGYGGLDTAKAEVTIPEMPSGTYRLGMTQRDSATTKGSIYVRAKNSASFLATLTTQGTPNATIDMSEVGAMGAYIISGTTYNEKFRFMVMPSSVFSSLANITEYNSTAFPTDVRLIDRDGIFKYDDYTLGDGTATEIENLLPLTNFATKGVDCAWFGDSISMIRKLPHLVGEKLAINVNDCSFSGAPLAYSSEEYTDTGFCSLCSQIVSGDFSPCEDAIELQYTRGIITENGRAEKLAQLATLASLDFSKIDKIVVLAGTNDLSVQAATIANIKSYFTSALTALLTEYPQLQIYYVLPPYRTGAYDVHPNGLTLPDINNAIKEVCELFGIPCFDFLHNCGVNAVTYTKWLPDGLHPSADGDEMFSIRIANWLNSIF